MEEIGSNHFFTNKKDAIETIYTMLDRDICARCENRIFYECVEIDKETVSVNTETEATQSR